MPTQHALEPSHAVLSWERLFTLSPHRFLVEAYRTLLRRNIDPSGYATYSQLLIDGCSYSCVIASLCGSDEFRAIDGTDARLTDFVERYQAAQRSAIPGRFSDAERDHPSDRRARAELRRLPRETPFSGGECETADAESPLWQGLFDHLYDRSHLLHWRTIGELVRQHGQEGILRRLSSSPQRPLHVVQFWDTADPPADVVVFMDMWAVLYPGRYHRFSSASALAFIETHFPEEFATAYGKCWHPAMQADFFRLCYLYRNGGAYIDADDVPTGRLPEFDLAGDQFLALRPLIHSIESGEKVALATSTYLERQESHANVEVYFNNSPILCSPRNQVLYLALIRAKSLLLSGRAEAIGIHDSTGPTTLSLSVVLHLLICGTSGRKPVDILSIDWDLYARVGTEAELAYKLDGRDWRKTVTEGGG